MPSPLLCGKLPLLLQAGMGEPGWVPPTQGPDHSPDKAPPVCGRVITTQHPFRSLATLQGTQLGLDPSLGNTEHLMGGPEREQPRVGTERETSWVVASTLEQGKLTQCPTYSSSWLPQGPALAQPPTTPSLAGQAHHPRASAQSRRKSESRGAGLVSLCIRQGWACAGCAEGRGQRQARGVLMSFPPQKKSPPGTLGVQWWEG